MRRFAITAVLCVIAISGCSKSGDDALVAKWEFGMRDKAATHLGEPGEGNPKVIVFSQGGAVSWDGESATWSWVKKGETNTVMVTRGPRSHSFDIRFFGSDAGSMWISNSGQSEHFTYYRK